jgi:pentapeptide repeat protein
VGQADLKPDRWQRPTAIASLLSVLVVGAGLIVTNNYNREQQQLALQGQITDRFTKAVEQLGQPGPQKIDVRLGAIYALQGIMRDSANDQPAVVDILSAFVRVHAPAPDLARNGSFTGKPADPPVDIQTALTVLARRDQARDGEGLVDLSQANLNWAVLSGGRLRRADLVGAYLVGAYLIGADLAGAGLGDADLDGAYLTGADLTRVDLRGARLPGANLGGADLRSADLILQRHSAECVASVFVVAEAGLMLASASPV